MKYLRDNCFRMLLLISLIIPTFGYTATLSPVTRAITISPDELNENPPPVNDPLEPLNRFIFKLNDIFDTVVLKPVATLYNKIMPHPLNRGVHNFFMNLNNVTTIANDVLQLHFHQAANDLWRLGINSTLGIGGLFDIAGRIGLPPYSNDFGLTLAHYGYRNSVYLVIPLLGPSSFRDALSVPVDYYGFSVYPYINSTGTRLGLVSLAIVDARVQLLQFQSVLDEAAVDKYTFQRNAYLQSRTYKINENDELGKLGESEASPEINNPLPGVSIGT